MKISELRELLADLGVRPSRKMGQSFLVDERVLRHQVKLAGIRRGETVLEVGAGIGNLTRLLAERADSVIAVEMDRRLCDYLEGTLPGNVELVCADVLDMDLPDFTRVVSNLPYQVSSPVTFKLLEHSFETGILMYQREFAERMAATVDDKGYSRLSVSVYVRAGCVVLETVPASAFYPSPAVESALVRLVPRDCPFTVYDMPLYLKLVDTLFRHRRKKIKNTLANSWRAFAPSKEDMEGMLEGVPYLDERVDSLSPEQIGIIADELYVKMERGRAHGAEGG